MKKIQKIVVSGDGQQKATSHQSATTQSKQKIRVAAYCRVSTLMEEQDLSYDSQVKYYKAFIESRPDMELVGVYGDHGASGLRIKDRPEFQRLLKDAMDVKCNIRMYKKWNIKMYNIFSD